jgi:N6-adenosine-specific RNA methylase IME4
MKQYDIILADPPWEYKSHDHIKKHIDEHYDTMTPVDLHNLDIKSIAKKDCVLYLWTTGPKMNEALELMNVWGFKYCTIAFVWDKQMHNMGFYSMSQVEYLLVGKRGKAPKRRKTNTYQFYSERRTKHSKKPEEFQSRIEEHWEPCEKIELFARRYRDDWDCIGNELNGTIEDFLSGVPMKLRDDQ